jgi:hypothetical protein
MQLSHSCEKYIRFLSCRTNWGVHKKFCKEQKMKKIFNAGVDKVNSQTKRLCLLVGFIVLLTAVIFTMAGCGGDPEGGPTGTPTGGPTGGHTHSYGTAWVSSMTQHWHECTGEDGEKSETANHTFNGGSCTICGYDQTLLKFGPSPVYDSEWDDDLEENVITGPLTSLATTLENIGQNGRTDDETSTYFTGSASVSNGNITINLTPKEDALNAFNEVYNFNNTICPADVKGIIVDCFDDDDSYYFSLLKEEGGVIKHNIRFIYVDRDVTFTDDTYYLKLNGLSVEKGWNYISEEYGTYTLTKITDISDYKWVNF